MIKQAIELELEVSKKVFNQVYLPYLNSEKRVQIFYGGSSSGKSFFLAQRVVLDVLQGRNYLVIRKVEKTLRESAYNQIVGAIDFLKVKKLFKINESKLTITCKGNNSQILFRGLDDREKIKSIVPKKGPITDIWIEEATETVQDDFKQLTKRLRGKSKFKKRITMSFNPVLKTHWISKMFFKKWLDNKSSYEDDIVSILKTTYKDNEFLEKDDREALESEDDKYYYDVYTLGLWGVLKGAIFKNWRVEDLSHIVNTFDKRRFGLDFGFVKPAAMPCCHFDRIRKKIYIYDEIYVTETTNQQLAKLIIPKIGKDWVTCDSAEPKSITELQIEGVKAKAARKGPDSIRHGLKWLQGYEFIVDPQCQNAINEFTFYKWKEDKDGNIQDVPVDKFNHLIDGLRYGFEDDMLVKENDGGNTAKTAEGTPVLPDWCYSIV